MDLRPFLTLLGLLCAITIGPLAWAQSPPHHRSDGFRNQYSDFVPRSLPDFLRWRWQAWRNDLPPPPRRPTPRVAPDLSFLRANAAAGAAMSPPARQCRPA